MSADIPHQVDYVTDEYAEKLDRFASGRDVSREAAERTFRSHCSELQGTLRDGTPENVIRRIAFHKLEWEPPGGGPSPDSEHGVEAGAQAGSAGAGSSGVTRQ